MIATTNTSICIGASVILIVMYVRLRGTPYISIVYPSPIRGPYLTAAVLAIDLLRLLLALTTNISTSNKLKLAVMFAIPAQELPRSHKTSYSMLKITGLTGFQSCALTYNLLLPTKNHWAVVYISKANIYNKDVADSHKPLIKTKYKAQSSSISSRRLSDFC
jgi:hypothetical protein